MAEEKSMNVGMIGDVTEMKGHIRICAIMCGTMAPANADGIRPAMAAIGDLVMIELPPNCSVIGLAGRTTDDFLRLISLAQQIGEHWRVQEGVNGALLDELAALTAPKEDARG